MHITHIYIPSTGFLPFWESLVELVDPGTAIFELVELFFTTFFFFLDTLSPGTVTPATSTVKSLFYTHTYTGNINVYKTHITVR